MTPLHVTAILYGGIVGRNPPMLDALLMAVVAMRENLVPLGELKKLEIPLQESPCGRYYLCSSPFCQQEEHDVQHKTKRAPAIEYARLGNASIHRVDISAGLDKAMYSPYVVKLLSEDAIEWWAIGDRGAVAELISDCHYVGKFRGGGKGRVMEWRVEECEPWGDGFPVLRDGSPMRPLPLDTPGLADNPKRAYHTLRPPYWQHEFEAMVAVPC